MQQSLLNNFVIKAQALLVSGLLLAIAYGPAYAGFSATGQICQIPKVKPINSVLAVCNSSLKTTQILVRLIGKRPNQVHQVQFAFAQTGKIFQSFTTQATPLVDPETVAVMLTDFNFDGWADFAIMKNINAPGPTRYLFYLYNPLSKKFQPSTELSLLENPEVIPAKKHIRSYWQRSDQISGWDIWIWQQNSLLRKMQVVQSIDENNNCLETNQFFLPDAEPKSKPTGCNQ